MSIYMIVNSHKGSLQVRTKTIYNFLDLCISTVLELFRNGIKAKSTLIIVIEEPHVIVMAF